MFHPTIFFDPTFVVNVIAGYLLTLGGAVLLLLAAIWSVVARGGAETTPARAPWRALCFFGVAVFTAGLLWQLIGYYRFNGVTFQ